MPDAWSGEVKPPPPYSLARTAERLVRFDQTLERFDGRRLQRLLSQARRRLLVSVEQLGPLSRPRLRVSVVGTGARDADARLCARRYVERALGAGAPVSPFYRAVASDPILGGAIRDFRGLRVAGAATLFEAMVTAILSQQINLGFAYAVRRDLVLRYGRSARFAGGRYWDFPAPRTLAALEPDALRPLRISGAKARAIVETARAFKGRRFSDDALESLSDEEVVERLVSLRGVGRWTAEVALMRGLARPDAFPAGDLGVVKYLAQELLGRSEMAKEDEMRAFSEAWRPHRALGLVYAYAELARRRASP